jgi:hypothetical protein
MNEANDQKSVKSNNNSYKFDETWVRKHWTPAHGRTTNAVGGEGLLLHLPCDWRFLPKLGPSRTPARGPLFLSKGSACVSRVFSVETRIETTRKLRPSVLQRSKVSQAKERAASGALSI